jgi:hypothetical protein
VQALNSYSLPGTAGHALFKRALQGFSQPDPCCFALIFDPFLANPMKGLKQEVGKRSCWLARLNIFKGANRLIGF